MSSEAGRYRSKAVVDAHRFEIWEGLVEWLRSLGLEGGMYMHKDGRVAIQTKQGELHADPGDWIVQGIGGEFHPWKPDAFAATYEPADQPEQHPQGEVTVRLKRSHVEQVYLPQLRRLPDGMPLLSRPQRGALRDLLAAVEAALIQQQGGSNG